MFSFLLLFLPLCSAAIYERAADLPALFFEYIIVGGGTAGNVLANRLTEETNTSVLVLEAGRSTAGVLSSQIPFFCFSGLPLLNWNFTTTPQPGLNNREFGYDRGFGLGGCSATNVMTYTRGSSEDYDRYANVSGDDGWGWTKMQPYFRKNERFVASADRHNTTGQFDPEVHGFHGLNYVSLAEYPSNVDGRVIQVTEELSEEFPFNLDYNSGYHLGIGWHQKTIGNGTRSSSETSYLAPEYIERENLHVLVDSHVTRILMTNGSTDDDKPYFDAVEFTQDAGKTMHTLSARKEIILSAGVIETPHILLNSGIGDADELSALGITPTVHLPDVGKNLRDQVSMSLSWTVNDAQMAETLYWSNETFREETLAQWQVNRTGFLANPPSNQLGFLRISNDVMEEETCAGSQTGHYELIFGGGLESRIVPTSGSYFTALINILCPLSHGNITINDANPLSPPIINPNVFSHVQDMVQMKYAIGGAQRFAAAPVWTDYILELSTDIDDLEGSIRDQARPTGHTVGTASMSPHNAHWGVVDPDLRLKLATGVRVVDASVLPYIPAGHPQAAVYAVAERAADLIKGREFA
ncbi:aryl-alcohol-oxidase from pleurotus Eryingii [Guyanagaster necrorhizus]|uniref:Aryl-alcohol-oxidase from pleurotus Eryingii n=1 Tax=Guyanagaster necrorhizus TaxID=856835 RepID=A0A9P7W271_9AGAR|nr:aryl-alcohol-oxidase from pleurotus Eryingii [Guyanagaster necrorhizus MCA 3950]KAG7450011.1 aryl-alcohol-oxidase from pleurotus Eryingii [Guyanagaster necrorhizus MCA 3950]